MNRPIRVAIVDDHLIVRQGLRDYWLNSWTSSGWATLRTELRLSTRKGLHKNYAKYVREFRRAGFVVDTESLSRSRRCSPAVCEFMSEKLGIRSRRIPSGRRAS
jgi:hypothetical protein